MLPEEIDKDVKEAVNAGSVDCITFTSSSTVKNFAKFFSSDDLRKSGSDIFIACIGPITADTARELGFNVNIIPQEYTLDALTESIVQYFSRKAGDE